MPDKALRETAKQYHLSPEQLRKIFRLLDRGYGIPYLMRYHKELTAGLKPGQIYELVEHKSRIEKLVSRRAKVLKKLKERGLLTDELKQKVREAATVTELKDHYIPYRPRKRSRSRSAMGQGLEPLAREVFSQEKVLESMGEAARPYVDPDKGLGSIENVLGGVAAIVCDWIAEERTHRERQRQVLGEGGKISSVRTGKSMPGRIVKEFKEFFRYEEKVSAIHPYRMLRIMRGKRLKVLRYRIEPPLEEMCRAGADLYLAGGEAQYSQVMAGLPQSPASLKGADLGELNSTEFLCLCITRSVTDILAPVLAREVDQQLCRGAERLALEILSRGLRSLLMGKPVPGQGVLGIKGGYRTGCKLAALDESGNVLSVDIVHPHIPRQEVEEATEKIAGLVEEHDLSLVAIGDGTACQETESLVSAIIQQRCPALKYAVVPEAGVEAYAKSKVAAKELPDIAPEYRASVSIGRRLCDPLSELVKVDPFELCTSEYAQEVDRGLLEKTLALVVQSCVCSVGVELNEATESVLRHVSGLDGPLSANIVNYRRLKGPFKNREQLKEVPGVGERVYNQAAGFIRTAASDNPLDRTRIHPGLYPVAERICEQLSLPPEKLGTEEGATLLARKRNEIKLTELEKEFGIHYLLLKDIVDELIDPWPDPRQHEVPPLLRQRQLSLEDLEPSQVVAGTVRNVVDFGVFVDIGVGEDALIHVSELADQYVHSPFDIVSVGDLVRATVVEVNPKKGRIALSMRSEPVREPARQGAARERPAARPRAASQKEETEVTRAKPGKAIQRPQSTLGWESRRVEKARLDRPLSKTEQQILKSVDAKERPQPAPARRQKKKKEQEEKLGGLLDRLEFATIERRGKPTD